MSAPTAADYAAALAAVDAYHLEGVAPKAMLTYIRARLAADVTTEVFVEAARAPGGLPFTVLVAREAAALDAYRAFVALAANADGAP